jgi:urease accessory protein
VTAAPAIRHQRSWGEVALGVERQGLKRLREAGAAKARMPTGGNEAILINTGGGLAGGDRFAFDIAAGEGAALTVTSQAAERVYRSLGESAEVAVSLTVAQGASLHWLPQETILFDGAALSRKLNVHIAPGARFLAVESFVLGRSESGETVSSVALRDRWRISCNGALRHGEDLALNGAPPASAATLGHNRAFATLLLISEDSESHLDAVRAAIGANGAASAWNGKLVARLIAQDGFALRKSLVPALSVLAGGVGLPKVWSL